MTREEFIEKWGEHWGGDENDPSWIDETNECRADIDSLLREELIKYDEWRDDLIMTDGGTSEYMVDEYLKESYDDNKRICKR